MNLRNIFLDTEFVTTLPGPEGLLSIALTDEHGHDYYAVNADADFTTARTNPWLTANVLPHLPLTPDGDLDHTHPDVKPRTQIARETALYLRHDNGDAHLHAWYAAQDVVRLHQLWDNDWDYMPAYVPRWATDIQTLIHLAGNPPLLPAQTTPEHHALNDARYNRELHTFAVHELRHGIRL
ncbi:hypothetical protein [Kitasatospora sp. NPDC087315]|uniref:hypothetical protein n=1 Tax=Kitasatospora sp. NPDC087315 TaxID=3364069 RepID=UPI0037F42187